MWDRVSKVRPAGNQILEQNILFVFIKFAVQR